MIVEHYEIILIGQTRKSTIEFYTSGDDVKFPGYRWRVKAGNGEIIGASTEGFTTMDAAKKNTFMLASTLAAFKFERPTDGF